MKRRRAIKFSSEVISSVWVSVERVLDAHVLGVIIYLSVCGMSDIWLAMDGRQGAMSVVHIEKKERNCVLALKNLDQ